MKYRTSKVSFLFRRDSSGPRFLVDFIFFFCCIFNVACVLHIIYFIFVIFLTIKYCYYKSKWNNDDLINIQEFICKSQKKNVKL